MNIIQRIVLLSGAMSVVVILLKTPPIYYFQGKIVHYETLDKYYQKFCVEMIDWKTIAISSAVIISATILIWFACKGGQSKKVNE